MARKVREKKKKRSGKNKMYVYSLCNNLCSYPFNTFLDKFSELFNLFHNILALIKNKNMHSRNMNYIIMLMKLEKLILDSGQ